MWSDTILNHPWRVAAVLLVVTAFFAYEAREVQIDPSVEGMIVEDDPELVYYRGFVERFGSDEFVIVGLRAPRLFARARLATIQGISEGLEQLELDDGSPAIEEVISLTDVAEIRSETIEGEPGLVVGPFVSELPETPAEERELWLRATSDPLFLGNFVSEPGEGDPDAPLTTLILGRIVDRPGDLTYRNVIHERVQELLERESSADPEIAAVHLAGPPILKAHIARLTRGDGARANALAWILNIALLLLLFRTLPGVWLPLVPVALAAAWTVGFVVLVGRNLNVLSVIVLPLIKVVGVATVIHMLSRYYEAARTQRDSREIARTVLRRVALPCFVACLTTALGFLSLLASPIVPVREVGLYSSFGVMAVWLLAILLVSGIMSRLRPPAPGTHGIRGSERLERALDSLTRFTVRFRWPVLAAAAAAMLLAAVGIARIQVETNVFEYFAAGDPVKTAYRELEREIGGIEPFNVSVAAPPGRLLEPETLSAIDETQAWLESQPEIDQTLSVVDYLKRLNQEMEGGDAAFHRLPDSSAKVANLLFLFENDPEGARTDAFLHPSWEDPSEARISARVRALDSATLSALIARTRRHLGEVTAATPDLAARVTGFTVLYAQMVTRLVEGQIWSFALAFATVWAVIIVLLRSFSAGTIAMIPNVFPIVLVLGLMGFSGISLNIGTAMIASICIGIAVDDTIHFMANYRTQLSERRDPAAAIRATMREVGRPIVLTSIVIALGFALTATASFLPLVHFGVLSTAAVLLALAGDLLLLPACLLVFQPGMGARALPAPHERAGEASGRRVAAGSG